MLHSHIWPKSRFSPTSAGQTARVHPQGCSPETEQSGSSFSEDSTSIPRAALCLGFECCACHVKASLGASGLAQAALRLSKLVVRFSSCIFRILCCCQYSQHRKAAQKCKPHRTLGDFCLDPADGRSRPYHPPGHIKTTPAGH